MSVTHPVDICTIAGAWRLFPGRAMSLRPKADAELRLRRGGAWVTLGETDHGMPGASGDRFLREGETLPVPAGAWLVMEALDACEGDEPVLFDWTDRVADAPASSRFSREVVTPSRDLVLALGQAALALSRVLRGLLGYGEFLVAGRGRVLTPLESMRS
jgi:hypothetical protein